MRYALFVTLILFALPAYAADDSAIGNVVEVDGRVEIKGAPLAIDDPVHLGDVLLTGPGARAHVVFIDDTEITLGENSQLKIDQYVFDGDAATPDKGHFSIAKGAFLFASGLINKSAAPDTQIQTPYGSIGLRGTTVWGGPMDGQYGVLVQDGSVVCETDAGMVALDKNEMSFFTGRKQMPVRMAGWTPVQMERAMGMVRLKNPEAVKKRIALRRQMNAETRPQLKERLLKKPVNQAPQKAPVIKQLKKAQTLQTLKPARPATQPPQAEAEKVQKLKRKKPHFLPRQKRGGVND